MKPTIYLSCLVVIIGCLVWTWTANAEGDQEFLSESTRLMNFLEKYSHCLKLTPDQQSSVDEAVRKYKEEKANQLRVEGVPAQGGDLKGCFGFDD